MMDTTLTFHLHSSHVTRLVRSCAAYRSYAWQRMSPSAERNQIMKALQAVQGRLAQAPLGGDESLRLTVSEEEKLALRQMMKTLMQMHGAEPLSQERNRVLGELASLRTLLEQGNRLEQAR